jgi:lipoate---protein ligase
MNNDIIINALEILGVKNAEASGRNDMVIDDKKISGSAYKLKLGQKDGSGRRSLHHGTMLLDLELGALGKYLSPNKKKLESKGVESVVSRVMNLKEIAPDIDHNLFCLAMGKAFSQKWNPLAPKVEVLYEKDLKQIP